MNDQGQSLESAPHQTVPPHQRPVPAMPAELAQEDTDPSTRLAPEIPGLDNPDVTVTLTPGTAAQLARHNALRAAPRHIGIVLAVAVPSITIALLWLGLPWEWMVMFQGAFAAYAAVVVYISLLRQYRSLTRSDITAGSCAIALGSDALDLAEGTARTRIGYDRIRSVTATRGLVTLSFDNRHLALPSALFPDVLLAELRRLIDGEPSTRAPLPPLPRLPHPQAHTVIAADTARRLTLARRFEPFRRASGRLTLAFLLAEACALGGLTRGAGGALVALVASTLAALAVRFWMRRPSENALRQYQGMLPAASGLAVQFGTDALILAGSTFLLRAPFSIATRLTVRTDCAVLKYGAAALVLPQALFPQEVLPRLRELGVTVVER
ncbi:hypothetical protein ACFXK0_02000 [Nocardia sp. NPDC059177]|uniref:hypothetical protein n=1 Tax=Nocardia sp. NPDC059177 TaxID=3346759 RepID=UPI0036B5AD9B